MSFPAMKKLDPIVPFAGFQLTDTSRVQCRRPLSPDWHTSKKNHELQLPNPNPRVLAVSLPCVGRYWTCPPPPAQPLLTSEVSQCRYSLWGFIPLDSHMNLQIGTGSIDTVRRHEGEPLASRLQYNKWAKTWYGDTDLERR